MRWTKRLRLFMLAGRLRPRRGEEWSIETIALRVEALTGEKVEFVTTVPSAVSGLCGARSRVGEINRLHLPCDEGELGRPLTLDQELVAAHELAHVACQHTSVTAENSRLVVEALRRRWPNLPERLVPLTADDAQAAREEREAELVAAFLLCRARPPSEVGRSRARLEAVRGNVISAMFGGRGSRHGDLDR